MTINKCSGVEKVSFSFFFGGRGRRFYFGVLNVYRLWLPCLKPHRFLYSVWIKRTINFVSMVVVVRWRWGWWGGGGGGGIHFIYIYNASWRSLSNGFKSWTIVLHRFSIKINSISFKRRCFKEREKESVWQGKEVERKRENEREKGEKIQVKALTS